MKESCDANEINKKVTMQLRQYWYELFTLSDIAHSKFCFKYSRYRIKVVVQYYCTTLILVYY